MKDIDVFYGEFNTHLANGNTNAAHITKDEVESFRAIANLKIGKGLKVENGELILDPQEMKFYNDIRTITSQNQNATIFQTTHKFFPTSLEVFINGFKAEIKEIGDNQFELLKGSLSLGDTLVARYCYNIFTIKSDKVVQIEQSEFHSIMREIESLKVENEKLQHLMNTLLQGYTK